MNNKFKLSLFLSSAILLVLVGLPKKIRCGLFGHDDLYDFSDKVMKLRCQSCMRVTRGFQ